MQSESNSQNNLKKYILIIFLFLISTIAVIAIASYALYNHIITPISKESVPLTLEIVRGSDLKKISRLLEEKGLIKKAVIFQYMSKILRKDNQIKAGEYLLNKNMNNLEILNTLIIGKALLYQITIPEGYNIYEIADLIENKGMGKKTVFLSLMTDKKLIDYLGLETTSLEGYLFPDTYAFNKGADELLITKKMLSTFKEKVMTDDIFMQAEKTGLTFQNIITLASMIEKETGVAAEKNFISEVFYNRIKTRMKLQCDPTVIYAIWNHFDGNLRKTDLSFDSPYNTYMYAGLPPGPIANPGLNSILAALTPSAEGYLYFVSKNNKTHKFSQTITEHTSAVKEYQLR